MLDDATHEAGDESRQQAFDFFAARRPEVNEAHRAIAVYCEEPIRADGVKMHVQIQGRAKSLHERHMAAADHSAAVDGTESTML